MVDQNAAQNYRRVLGRIRQTSATQASGEGRHFVSYYDLQNHVTPLVSQVVDAVYPIEYRREGITQTIIREGLRLLSILVWMRQESEIFHFLEHGELDSRLPMEASQVSRIAPEVESDFWDKIQWEYFPYVFGGKDFHHRINQPKVILPFTEENFKSEGAGGELTLCTIPPGQQKIIPNKTTQAVRVIRKRLKMLPQGEQATEKTFQRELESLEFLNLLRHRNIIELLTSYTYNRNHYLLFPVLPMDLDEFLRFEQRYEKFQSNLTFYTALSGLASALETVHRSWLKSSATSAVLERIGYHHDVRPKNVLVTSDTFILSDFGLARFKPTTEDSKTPWRSGHGDYIAPECLDPDFNRLKVGRSIDMWSFGCLVTEIATYLEKGPRGVKDFRDSRIHTRKDQNYTEYYFFQDERLKDSVTRWLLELATKPRDPGIRCLVLAVDSLLKPRYTERTEAPMASAMFAYIAMKMTYRAALEMFQRLVENTTASGAVQPWTSLSLWFDMERYKAWGRVLGMEEDTVRCRIFESHSTIYVKVLELLEKLFQHFQTAELADDSSARNPEDVASRLSDSIPMPTGFDDEIRQIVHDLWTILPGQYQTRMEQVWRQIVLDTSDQTMLDAIEHGTPTMDSSQSSIGARAALRRLEDAVWRETSSSSPGQKKLLLKLWQVERGESINFTQEFGWLRMRAASYSETTSTSTTIRRPVYIEWVLYSPSWEGQSDEEKITKLLAFADMLHHPKPDQFHVLDCAGVLPPTAGSGHDGFGFVYELPEDASEKYTLLEVIKSKKYTPLLEEKYIIGKTLATSLLELHFVGWLHKNLQSQNILLLAKWKLETLSRLPSPYLVGFHHSRPDGEVWYSETDLRQVTRTEYLHPEYNPGITRFKKEYDYYSLGIVLLEIGFWRPISAFKNQHPGLKEEGFRQLLHQTYAPMLGSRMGSLYRDAVTACLSGDLRAVEEQNTADELARFYWSVVAKLTACKVS
ncbi:MAG: hypothetical protein M1820_008790 [Bogoriella megaspora]|nr:MAG: hypothetical protein M1820_008790 [Bogoriella megaspora]